MRFFQSFPFTTYDISGEQTKSLRLVKDIFARVKVLNSIKAESFIYYLYDVKDGDTPEILANNYYGNPNRHWIILLANDIVDPFYDWPLTYTNFVEYIKSKYGSVNTAQTTYAHYEKIITKLDSVTSTTTVNKYKLDYDTYFTLPSSSTQTINLKDGNTVSITTTKNAVSYYDYENELNEQKRTIKILDKQYVGTLEREMKLLLQNNV